MGNKRVWTDEEIIFVLMGYLDGLSNENIQPLFQAKFGVEANANDIRYAINHYPDSPDYGAIRTTNMTGAMQMKWGIVPAVYDFTPTFGHRMKSTRPCVRVSTRKPKPSNRDEEYLNGTKENIEKQRQQEDRVLLHHLDCHAFLRKGKLYIPWDDNVIRAATPELLNLQGFLAVKAKQGKRWQAPIVIPDDDESVNPGTAKAQAYSRKRSRVSVEDEQGNPSNKRARLSTCDRCSSNQPIVATSWNCVENSYSLPGPSTYTNVTDFEALPLPSLVGRGLTPSPTDTENTANTAGSFDLTSDWSATACEGWQIFDANQLTFDQDLFDIDPNVSFLPESTVDADPVKPVPVASEAIASNGDVEGLEWMNNLTTELDVSEFLNFSPQAADKPDASEADDLVKFFGEDPAQVDLGIDKPAATETDDLIKLLQEDPLQIDLDIDTQLLQNWEYPPLYPGPVEFDPLSPSRVFDDDYELNLPTSGD